MAETPDNELIEQISPTWPGDLAFSRTLERSVVPARHPLGGELTALKEGLAASLPYFTRDKVVWATVAPDSGSLLKAISDLRAWVIPSFGWEDETQPLVLPGETNSRLVGSLFAVSPHGYFKWWTNRSDVSKVIERLKRMRALAELQPVHDARTNRSLFELRHEFEVALLTGDPVSAQEAIDEIDKHELDSATSTGFMQIRLWHQFRENRRIVEFGRLDELVQVRVPSLVRKAVLQAFYEEHISRAINPDSIESAVRSFATQVRPVVAGLIERSEISEDITIARLLALNIRESETSQVPSALLELNDEFISRVLEGIAGPSLPPPPRVEVYLEAIRKGDWATVQRVGREIIEKNGEIPEEITVSEAGIVSALLVSLNVIANQQLKDWLEERASSMSVTVEPEKAVTPEPTHISPQNWTEFFETIGNREAVRAAKFLELDNRPNVSSIGVAELDRIVTSLEEMLTDPSINAELSLYSLCKGVLPVIVGDLLSERSFPRSEFKDLYARLLVIWAEYNRGSVLIPDSNVLLTLAESVFELSNQTEAVVIALKEWWQARRVKALLPFLLNAVDMISHYSNDTETAQNLWLDGAGIISVDKEIVTRTELELWKRIGVRIGVDQATVLSFLNVDTTAEDSLPDPLANINLSKVAVVSLQRSAAETAAELIRERTGANVVVVDDTVAGAGTNNARTADVILFVWSAASHAVYRAFDDVRERIAYVQGTGANSIVIALERWVATLQL